MDNATQVSDTNLVVRARHGDRDAFGQLYDRHAGLVRALIWDEFRNVPLMHDLVQDVFLRAWQRLDALREPEQVGSWLAGFARQICREQRRSYRRDRHVFVGQPREDESLTLVDVESDVQRDITQMLQQVAELPERERLAIHSFYLNGDDACQTGQLLKLSRSGVYQLLARACRRLATKMQPTSTLRGSEQ